MRSRKFSIGLRAILAIFAVTLSIASISATTWSEKVLRNIYGGGAHPLGGALISDASGNLYGTTYEGGAYGYGLVFELSPDGSGGWTETVLYDFCSQSNCADGANPVAGLVLDAAGNLYGTTYGGGTGTGTHCASWGGSPGFGTVFEVTPWGGETVLYSFCPQGGGCSDGEEPASTLIFDAAGNLYGTTYFGGGVFELSPNQSGDWTLTVLYALGSCEFGCQDGYYPASGVIFDAAGNLYGTTSYGGAYGYGTAYELTPARGGGWTETIIHNFDLGSDGGYPEAALTLDSAGNVYGTLYSSGVFELTPTKGGWTEKILHGFNCNGNDGCAPYGGVIFDAAGNLYGTTEYGGIYGGCNGGTEKCGIAFELTPTAGGPWTETILHYFGKGNDGAQPYAGLILDAAGNLYGTTWGGGTGGYGTVFELTPVHPCVVCSHAVR